MRVGSPTLIDSQLHDDVPLVMSAADLCLLSEMIRRAEADNGDARSPPSLLNVLRKYEDVLRENGVGSSSDTYFYKIILRLSRLPGNDWWAKLAAESEV